MFGLLNKSKKNLNSDVIICHLNQNLVLLLIQIQLTVNDYNLLQCLNHRNCPQWTRIKYTISCKLNWISAKLNIVDVFIYKNY